MRKFRRFAFLPVLWIALLLSSPEARGAWAESAWPFRRTIDVSWEAEKGTGDELAITDFYTDGLHEPSGENIRVATDEGRLVPCRCLMIGPGDRMRILFSLVRGARRYQVYFGHPKPPPLPKNLEEIRIERGVLLEMHRFKGPVAQNAMQMEKAWGQSGEVIGRTLLPQIYLGFNPFDDQVAICSRFTGTIRCPADGEYTFAMSASDKGALFVDDKPLVFCPTLVGDTRFHAKATLQRGPHKLTVYQQNVSGEQRITVVWSRPDDKSFKLIGPETFGVFYHGTAGALESNGKQYLADFRVEYGGECFFADHYAHRYRFSATHAKPAAGGPKTTYEWDFGDGQTALAGPTVDHVFLAPGDYTVKLSMKSGLQADTRSNRLRADRVWERVDNPPTDLPSASGKIAAEYDIAKIPERQLVAAVLLYTRSQQLGAMEKAAVRLAGEGGESDPAAANALAGAADELAAKGQIEGAVRIWNAVPANSPLRRQAVQHAGELLLWRMADFSQAVRVLEPAVKAYPNDTLLKRLYGQALILDQRAAEGKKVLESIPAGAPADRQAAITGALARTIEFYADEKDWESGETAWEKWQQQYPVDFLEGYSVLLRTRLMESARAPVAAAKVAEAFALAMPRSSYAPRLLDRASKLLASSDPGKSQTLRALLKQKYPEDPLAQ